MSTAKPFEFEGRRYSISHTWQNTPNRILKATMRRLIRVEGLASKNAEQLVQLCRLFSGIDDVELTNRVFGQVQLYRNSQFYDFLLKACELIHRNLLISEKSGASKFRDFVQDERQMPFLYEEFVRNFYRVKTCDAPRLRVATGMR